MSGWTEQELIYEAAFQYEWGYSGELEKAARECIARLKAEAWDEGYEAGSSDVELHLAALHGHTDYDEYEDTPNPYQDN